MMTAPMTDEEAEVLRKKLSAHYNDQVLTVREFCEAMKVWSTAAAQYLGAVMENTGTARPYAKDAIKPYDASRLFLAADKSSLLGRLFYGREKLRTKKCPTHDGKWSGCFLECPCEGTGWLPEDE